ncbi:MAG: RNA polymerase factor sigma-54 [Bacteroidota bacterium]|nr:RNA polymerase factor sigma-54 [Bacteroidota bacterium]
MAMKQSQQMRLQQKLSPQQIQLMKLLQLPAMALEQRIKEELEANPALEEGEEEMEEEMQEEEFDDDDLDNDVEESDNSIDDDRPVELERVDDEVTFEDYMDEVEVAEYKYEINNNGKDDDRKESPISVGPGFHDVLEEQLGLRDLSDHEYRIGLYLIGCIDEDGYLRRDLSSVVDDIAFSQNITTDTSELEKVLKVIQTFDPAGVGARNLQECLLLQLDRKNPRTREIHFAIDVVKHYMDEFSKKHYEKIAKNIEINDEEEFKDIINEITHLNPKPGGASANTSVAGDIVPDFVINNSEGKLELSLNQRNMPELKLSKDYLEMLTEYSKNKDRSSKEATTFVKSKIESAQWFIDALFQRQQTLLVTMNSIMKYQAEYFLTGDETKLRPMILKDIAESIGLDISTVSRVANSKYVTTPFGNFLLKSFFSESLSTDSGEEVSTREVKKILRDCIDAENKKKPLTDDALMVILKEKGYNIARRTIAKYREQLDIPVARMRKEI